MVSVACAIYGRGIKTEVARSELRRKADVVSTNLYEVDNYIKTAIDYSDISAVACKSLGFYTDKSKIHSLLEYMARTDYVDSSFVCNFDGKGYDHRGEELDISSEPFFAEAMEKFSKGGNGLLLVPESTAFSDKSILVINQIYFRDQVKGFLMTVLHVGDLADKIFAGIFDIDKMALISLAGDIVASPDDLSMEGNFWDDAPSTLPADTIKLNISRKTLYINEIDDYGYVVVVPSKVTLGAAVLLVDHKSFSGVMSFEMRRYRLFTLALLGIVFVFSSMMIISYFIRLRIIKSRRGKNEENAQKDKGTGLLNGLGVAAEMSKYIEDSNIKKGIMLSIFVEEFRTLRNEKGDEEADRQIGEFSRKLAHRYRFTDIVGKISDGEYVIFVKDVEQEKDIRKQADDLQIFLYDIKNDVAPGGKPLNASAGGALYPRDGSNADELLSAARAAMEKARIEGSGRVSFYR